MTGNLRDRTFRMIDTNGVRLRCVVEGDGPLVILLHGFPQCWYLWRHQIDPLIEAGYTVCVPDQRGYGASDAPSAIEDYDIVHLSGDVAGIATELGHRRFVVIGHDWGAPVAWHTALAHADRVRGVMGMSIPYTRGGAPEDFVDPPALADRFWYIRYFQQPGLAEAELDADIERSLHTAYCAISADTPSGTWMAQGGHPKDAGLLDVLAPPAGFSEWLTREDLDYYVAQYAKNGFRGGLNWYRNIIRNHRITPELAQAKITQPAHFAVGAEDDVLLYVPDWIERMKDWVIDLRKVHMIEGAGHWVQAEKPAEINAAIREFLADVAD